MGGRFESDNFKLPVIQKVRREDSIRKTIYGKNYRELIFSEPPIVENLVESSYIFW